MTEPNGISPDDRGRGEMFQALGFLAYNLRSSWDARAADVFRSIDRQLWASVRRNPVAFLKHLSEEALLDAARDDDLVARVLAAEADLRYYLDPGRDRTSAPSFELVAYFSPEFGVAEFLPTYSGGLGILAGDHLKAASDLGLPLVGVGLLYREGYFRQALDESGWQQESYPRVDNAQQPLIHATDDAGEPLVVEVDMAERMCRAQVWVAQVGRVSLLLLDCDIELNHPDERAVTDRLYGGDREHRLRQEIVLGIGGVRAVRALGLAPDVWHSNEGHAGFLGLERIREYVAGGIDFEKAVELVRPATVFTTHTPLAVAIDEFDLHLMERYFTRFAEECGVEFDRLLGLGRPPEAERRDPSAPALNMAVMGIRLAERVNGVSALHGEVSRDLFKNVWPELAVDEVPISHVTNGVHIASWIGPETRELGEETYPPGWVEDPGASWSWAGERSDAELWAARCSARTQLVDYVRRRLRVQLEHRGFAGADLGWTDEALDENALTIGFARRFAQYKRATLMLSDPDRLLRLLLDEARPLQIVIAGKAHPLDDGGKEMMRSLIDFSLRPDVRGKIVFIEDYDMQVGRVLTRGADVWLNNPRRPLEACGTSGMKAALNGVLNLSVLDGWWDEMFDERVGWAIGGREVSDDLEQQDLADAKAIYRLLEEEVIPLYYERSEQGVPAGWIEKMRASMAELGGRVSAHRMLDDYVSNLYEPAARAAERVQAT